MINKKHKALKYNGGSKTIEISEHDFTNKEVKIIIHANAANRNMSSMLERKLELIMKGK